MRSRLGDVGSIAVLRALPGLGDLLCAIPALRALRAAHPGARITLIGLPAVAPLLARFARYVDELLPFPGFPGIPEVPFDAARTAAFLTAAQARRFDVAIQLHGSGRTSNPFVALLGARRSAGFALPGFVRPDPELFLDYPADRPEPLRHLALMGFLGMPAADAAFEFPLEERDCQEAELALRDRGVAAPYACVNVGAAEPQRRWPLERFAAVADGLAERGMTPVLLGAPGEEPLAAATAAQMTHPAADLAGATSIGALAAVLRGATLTVTNDTGTSHLAAAVGAPSVVIFSTSDPRRWAPLDGALHRAVRGPVDPADVLAQCDELLAARAQPGLLPQARIVER